MLYTNKYVQQLNNSATEEGLTLCSEKVTLFCVRIDVGMGETGGGGVGVNKTSMWFSSSMITDFMAFSYTKLDIFSKYLDRS